MKQYRLLKDLPTFKAGQLAYISKTGNLIAGTPENQKTTETGLIIMIYHETTLKKFPNILTEWFEEIEEPTDSAHWKPQLDDRYWSIDYWGNVDCTNWGNTTIDVWKLNSGNVYRTEEECEKARVRRLAKVRLQRTSDFKPDFEDCRGGWVVYYNYKDKELYSYDTDYDDSGEIVHYATSEDARKSIKENREDWLTYFGIKEEA